MAKIMLRTKDGSIAFLAGHRFFTWRPRLCRYNIGWSFWWLWFEAAHLHPILPSNDKDGGERG